MIQLNMKGWSDMKKLTGILLTLILCISIFMSVVADDNASPYKITINGVNIVFTDGKTVLEPIENDSVVYVPLEAFLKTMNIDYKFENNEYTISTASSVQEATPTPKPASAYDSLTPAEKEFMEKFLPDVKYFNDPSSLRIVDIRKGKRKESSYTGWQGDGGYFVLISATNSMGGKIQKWVVVDPKDKTFELFELDANSYSVSEWSTELRYNITELNKALKQKLEEMGY